MDDLLQEFIAETRETLAAIAGEIVAWEAEPSDRTRLDAIFRFVHTVKGSCGFLDLPRLERLSHAAEEVLADVRAGRRAPDAALVSAVLGVIDRIGELVEAIDTGESLPDEEDQLLVVRLEPGSAAASPLAVQTTAQRGVARTIRLPIDLLDRMMGGVSDMVLARNELSRKLRDSGCDGAVEAAFERLSVCVAEMRDAITRTRMQRIDNIFSTLPRMVRDLSAELGKLVMLEIDGGDVELDREMIEMIRDPLGHIIRNAIDHGIEPPDDRRVAGKSAAGRLAVTARQAGNQILIEVTDDGRGIDGDRLVTRAVAAGLLSPARADALNWSQKLALVFEPGLSTATQVTAISGRGVGMDVVRANIERIGGIVELDSRPYAGLRLTLRVPLTLTIIPALTVSAAGQQFAIPRSTIEEIVRAGGDGARIEPLGGARIANIRGRRVPVISLEGLIGSDEPATPSILVVLKPAGGDYFALAVDAVHDHEELVVKPAAPAVMATGIYAGTTLPDNGRPMLLLDPGGIASLAGAQVVHPDPVDVIVEAGSAEEAIAVPTLLFRDLDGVERAIRLALVERIEDVSGDAVRFTGGRLRLAHQGRIVPLMSCTRDLDRPRLRILRMNDGTTQIAYGIEEVIDIVDLVATVEPAAQDGAVTGVVLVSGRQVELLDPYWLFAQATEASPPLAHRPLALLGDAGDPWVREVLRPLIEAAGYRVALVGQPGMDRADIVIVTGDTPRPPSEGGAPVIRLRADPQPADTEDASIYRYDRAGLISALRARAPAGRG